MNPFFGRKDGLRIFLKDDTYLKEPFGATQRVPFGLSHPWARSLGDECNAANMKVRISRAIVLAAMFATVLQGAVLSYPDPPGDWNIAQNDISALQTEAAGERLKITVVYGKQLDLLDMNFGNVFIDGDLNPDTGVRLGADCILEFILAGDYPIGFVRLKDRSFKLNEEGTSATTGTNSISFFLPFSLWGGNQQVRLFAASAWTLESTLYDRVPNSGWLDMRTGVAVMPRVGNERVQVALGDSPTDASFPNFKEVEAKVSEGNLLLWLTFGHSVENSDIKNDILVIRLGLDLDERLWTGFINGHEDPPTFGFDRDITLMLSHVFSEPYGDLRWQVPPDPDSAISDLLPEFEGIGLGGQSTDTRLVVGQNSMFKTASNQVFLSIPLAYLGSDDGEMYISAEAFLQSTLSGGHSDSLPDSGAMDTTPGLPVAEIIHPVSSCAANEVVGTDDPNDSFGFGYQGDEIVSSHACALGDGSLKITTDLESLEMSDLAFVNLFVDADGNVNTGLRMQNGTPEIMGADFYLSFRVSATPDPGIVSALLMDFRAPPLVPRIRRADQLVSLRLGGTPGSGLAGARYSVTLPQELLGLSGGATVRYALTTTQQAYNAKDSNSEDPPGPDDPPSHTLVVLSAADVPSLLDTAPSTGFFHVPAPANLPLSISSVTPGTGPESGGTTATLHGSSFGAGAGVRFGDTPVPVDNTRVISSGKIRVTTPPHPAGTTSVSVRNPGGIEAIRANGFVYGPSQVCAPAVRSIDPSLGPISGLNTVEIRGVNFVEGATVRFGAGAALGVNIVSPFTISAMVPPGAVGGADVIVTNPDGQSGRLSGGYNYGSRPPSVWAIYPNFGPTPGGTLITVIGEGFEQMIQVRVGGVPLENVNIVSGRMITGTTQGSAIPGPASLALTNADGAGRILAAAFTYGGTDPSLPAPSIIGVTPYSSPTEGGEEVSILGTGFCEGAAVLVDGYPVQIKYFDTGLIQISSPPHASDMVPIKVVNPDGKDATLPVHQEWDSFTYSSDQPNIWMVNPMSSPTIGGERITIFGGGFKPGATVEFGGIPGFDIDLSSDMIFVTSPPHAPGAVGIKITNPNRKSTTFYGDIIFGEFGFYGPAPLTPQISSVAPNSGTISGGTRVTLQGDNLYAGARVFFGSREAASVTRLSSTMLIASNPPAATPGTVDILVRNPDNQKATAPYAFTYAATVPQITGVRPSTGSCAGNTFATLSGTGFMPGTSIALDGNAASGIRFVSPSSMNFQTPPGFPGGANITVKNPGGVTSSLPDAFTYTGDAAPAPQIGAILPSSGPVQGGTPVTIVGHGFLEGASASIGGRPIESLNLNSTSEIKGVAPPNSAGASDIVVSNVDGQISFKSQAFVYIDPSAANPQVTAIVPASGPKAGGANVIVHGQFFQPGAQIQAGPFPLAHVQYVSSSELRAETTPGSAGEFPVRVWNPDGKTNALGTMFTYLESTAPLMLVDPTRVGTNFTFRFLTKLNNQYVIQCKEALDLTTWTDFETINGNGSFQSCTIPMTNVGPRFFRIRGP